MASRMDMMGVYEPDNNDEAWHLLRKTFLLLLVITALALGLVLLSRRSSNVPLLLFNILADGSLGLMAGFATRLVLRGRHGLIQGLFSAAIGLIGLTILGYFTNWRSGIGPFQAGLVPVHWLDAARIGLRLPLQFSRSPMDLLDLAHAVIVMDASWIALRVWKQAAAVSGQAYAPVRRARRGSREPVEVPEIAASYVAPSVPARRIPASGRVDTRSRVKRKRPGRPVVSKAAPVIRPMKAKPPRSSSRLRHRRPAVRLAVYEEHKCPFCLEPVNRNDPRGVVECEVCHTLHHKDCWDITGSCQVPHLNT